MPENTPLTVNIKKREQSVFVGDNFMDGWPYDASRPVISVGVPVYNEERYIEKRLASIVRQSYPNLEIIISDNASSDRTWELIQDFAAKDERVLAIRQEHNKGSMFNFQYVLHRARGKYFLWAGAHDLWDLDMLEKCVQAFDTDDRLSLVVPKTHWINAEDDVIRTDKHLIDTHKAATAAGRVLTMLKQMNRCNAFYGLFKRSALLSAWPPPDVIGSDAIALVRIAAEGNILTTHVSSWYRRLTHVEQSHIQSYRRYVELLGLHGAAATFPALTSRIVMMKEYLRCDGSIQERMRLLGYTSWRLFLQPAQCRILVRDTLYNLLRIIKKEDSNAV